MYKLQINEADDTPLQVNYVALVDNPAIELNWIAFDKQLKFSVDTEKRLIMGALMIASMPIYRKDETRGEYYVVFDKDTIYQIVQKFFRKGFVSRFNIMHDEGKAVDGVYIIESFIVDDTRGVTAPKAFEGISQGSWLATVKVDNDEVWNDYIKTGELKGFSVEGMFAMGEMVRTDEEVLQEIADIVSGK
jgi:hypothetical protein